MIDCAALRPGAAVVAHDLDLLAALPDGSVDVVYVDPPFNTGRERRGGRLRAIADEQGVRRGYAGRLYRVSRQATQSYADSDPAYVESLRLRVAEARRVLAEHGTLYLHLDPRESHYCKVMCDGVFGRDAFLNEVVWAYDYGGRPRRRWPAKHDVILVYARHPGRHHFDLEEVDRVPYLAPGLQTRERAARGKTPTDVWWHTVVPTTSRERTGYPTQKPVAVVRRALAASCPRDGLVLDWCAGSGTTGAAALSLGRRFLCGDSSAAAVEVMRRRFAAVPGVLVAEAVADLPRRAAA